MTLEQFGDVLALVARLWETDVSPAMSIVEAFPEFEGYEAVDAKTAVYALFREGREFRPKMSVLRMATVKARDARLEAESFAERKAHLEALREQEDRMLPDPTGSSGVRKYAREHNGYSPVQVFKASIGGNPGPPIAAEYHDPERGIPDIDREEHLG